MVNPSGCGKLAYFGWSVIVVRRSEGSRLSGDEILFGYDRNILRVNLLCLYACLWAHI